MLEIWIIFLSKWTIFQVSELFAKYEQILETLTFFEFENKLCKHEHFVNNFSSTKQNLKNLEKIVDYERYHGFQKHLSI